MLVTAVDQAGTPLSDVTVTYRVDGGAAQTLTCGSNGVCAVGQEVSGTFAISAARPGHAAASGTVTVTRDACHVRTEFLVLRLVSTP